MGYRLSKNMICGSNKKKATETKKPVFSERKNQKLEFKRSLDLSPPFLMMPVIFLGMEALRAPRHSAEILSTEL
jgi:hypothetical protein